MRIGTWNLDAKWSSGHAATLTEADCDVWLLTEVTSDVDLAGYTIHRCEARMSPGQHYAGVMARLLLDPQPDPHPATAAALIGDLTFYSSVLPWADRDDPAVWGHGDQAQRTRQAISALRSTLVPGRFIWGGDFNHALSGPTQWAGSAGGRNAINALVNDFGIKVLTAGLPHRRPGINSIDHVGVPDSWTVIDARRVQVSGCCQTTTSMSSKPEADRGLTGEQTTSLGGYALSVDRRVSGPATRGAYKEIWRRSCKIKRPTLPM